MTKRTFEIRHLSRAGGHAIIQWLYNHYDNYKFFNNISNWRVEQRFEQKGDTIDYLFYSLENSDLNKEFALNWQKLTNQPFHIFPTPTKISVIRDPLNYAISLLKGHGGTFNAIQYKEYLNSNIYTINYNKWFVDEPYRRQIEKDLDLPLGDDSGIDNVLSYGGGSSFNNMDVLNRWVDYKDHTIIKDINTSII